MISTRVLRPKKKVRSPWKLSRTVNGFTLLHDSRVGVSVLKGGCTRSSHEFTWSERLIFAGVTVHSPSPQTTSGIHNLPPSAREDFWHRWRFRLNGCAVTQCALAQFCSCVIARDCDAATAR